MIIPEKERKEWGQLFDYIYQGNNEAKAISIELLELVHSWDDLYDKDNDISPEQVNKALFSATYSLQKNPIWQHCSLIEHMLNVILRWQDANVLESEQKGGDLNKAYMLRAGIYDLFPVVAYHLYGMEWAQHIGPMVRRFYCEDLEDFKKELSNA